MAEINPNILLQLAQNAQGNQVNFPGLAQLSSQLQGARQQREMQQFELNRAQKGAEDEDELRALVAGGGSPQEIQARLMGAGRLKEAVAYQEQLTKQQTAKLAQQEQVGKILKQATGSVVQNPTEQNAIAVIARLEAMTGQPMDEDRAQIYSFKGDPNAIKRWAAGHAIEAEKLLPKVETKDLGGTSETQNIDPLTGEVLSSTSRAKTMTPGEIASNQVARGNLSVAQQKLSIEQGKEQRESVSQQKLNLKLEEDARKAASREREGIQTIDNTLQKLDQIIGKDDKGGMVNRGSAGIIGKVSSFIPETPAYELEKKIDSVKSALGFDTLQQMRDASPTGGALGQVAVRELEFLQAKVASLDIGQSPKQLKQHLKEVQTHYKKWREAVGGKTQVTSLPDPATHNGYEATSDDGVTYISNGSKWMRKR